MTRSTGTCGLIFLGSPPSNFMASRMAARSTTAGTPVKSCISTRAGRKARNALEAVSLGGGQAVIGVALATNLKGLATSEAVERSHLGCFHSRRGASAVDRSKLLAGQGFSRWSNLRPKFVDVAPQVRGL